MQRTKRYLSSPFTNLNKEVKFNDLIFSVQDIQELYSLLESLQKNVVFKGLLTTKGDLLTRTSSGVVREGVGEDDSVYVADSTQGTGHRWKPLTEFDGEIVGKVEISRDDQLIGTQKRLNYHQTDLDISITDDGSQINITPSDNHTRNLIRKLIFDLVENGIPVEDEELLNELNYLK